MICPAPRCMTRVPPNRAVCSFHQGHVSMCACGRPVIAPTADDAAVEAAVRQHQSTPRHRLWRLRNGL